MAVYLIAAGGTGGHIHPGIAIADKIRNMESDAVIYFCGTTHGMENQLVPAHGYELLPIDALGFAGKSPKEIIRAVFAFYRGKAESKRIIRDKKVDFVIGTGGYVCGPVLSAAKSLKIPSLIHEQNAFPGKANRWLADKVSCVCISYPSTAAYFSKASKVKLTGNPVREVFFDLSKEKAREELAIGRSDKVLFVTGGSLGARSINNAVALLAERCPDPGYRIILACGFADYPELMNRFSSGNGTIDIHEYISSQHLYLAAADLILCRAGAITCSEIAVLGKASIMVPYPFAAGDHQTLNAKAFENVGATVLVPDRMLDAELLKDLIAGLMNDPAKLADMEKAARKLAYPDAVSHIYEQISLVREDKCQGI
ncbi:MAG: undecaprenyldiphospho-muramoylpentapeptide beta-N-acetylglucosaminyltransferase [Saccharofermentanales bacterium]